MDEAARMHVEQSACHAVRDERDVLPAQWGCLVSSERVRAGMKTNDSLVLMSASRDRSMGSSTIAMVSIWPPSSETTKLWLCGSKHKKNSINLSARQIKGSI